MIKSFYCLAAASIFVASLFFGFGVSAQSEPGLVSDASFISPHLVVSQFQVAGGSATDEFIELHNTSANNVDLNGYRVIYRSAGGVNDVPMVEWTTSTIVPPGGFYLVTSSGYDGTVPGNISYNTGSVSMSATGGGIGIRQGPLNTGGVIDSVGYGTATNIFVEGTVTTAPATHTGQTRAASGCQDTDNNSADFSNVNPAAPRNTSASVVMCSGGGTNLFASITANPTTITVPGTTLLTVLVVPATTPPSTNISVTGDLSDIAGLSSQTFFDDGTNGDVTPGDNTFSYLASIPGSVTTGTHVVTATAHDGQGRNAVVFQNLSINGATPVDDALLFGNPTNATSNVADENNYLMQKPQYSLSYSRSKATANWTAWRLDSSWIGTAPRQDDFRPDPALPSNWYHVTDNDYSGSGYDRGHMCPSGDRTRTIPDNSATFLMTNIIPQLGANNQGPWADLENYCRTLASQGNEMYIISGGYGSAGTIGSAQNPITVPAVTWKVVLVMPNGNNDLSRISRSTRAFGVIMSNQSITQGSPWRNYRTTVDAVEYLTGYNFFSAIPKNTQEIIERRRDRQ